MTPTAPRPAKDTVYVDAEDDITAIIDKVDASKNKVVALVLPKRAPSLQSIVNMRLLKRSAKKAGKSVVLITSEQALLPLAGAAEVHVAKSLQSKPEVPPPPDEGTHETPANDSDLDKDDMKLDGTRPIGELAVAHGGESDPIDLDDENSEDEEPKHYKKPKDKKFKVPNFERFRLMMMAGILGVLLLIFLLVFGLFVWPSATITIQTSSTPITANFTIDATDKAKVLDEAGGVIPASSKTSDQTGSAQAQATGQQNNGTKAAGSVTFTNCSQDGSSRDVPAGSGVSSGGLTYITQSDANMPNSAYFVTCKSNIPNSNATVAITAQSPGAKYNIGTTSFTVHGVADVTASGSASGGTDNIQTILSQSDVDGAKQKAITSQSSDSFTKNFEQQLSGQGLYVITSTLKAGDPQVSATPAVGQPASTSNVSVKVTYSVLTVQKSDFAKTIKDQLSLQINTKEQKISSSDVTKDASVTVQSSSGPGEANLQISESTTAIPTLDLTTIEKKAGGLKSGDIASFISNYPGVKNVTVKMSPFWVSKAPKKPAKIHIVQQQVKSKS